MAVQVRSARAVWLTCLISALGWAGGSTGGATTAHAQALTSLEFSFSNPGARSLGFGGAFVALADDATAAFANPAGLIQIAEPEVSIEGRSWSYATPYTSGGRAAGEPTGLGIDTSSFPRRDVSRADLAGLSYVSFVYPRRRWSVAFFQHQLANFEFDLETQGVFGPGPLDSTSSRTPAQRADLDLEVVSHGLAVGVRAGEKLSLGLSLSHHEPSILLIGLSYLADDDSFAAFFSEASFLPERLDETITVESNASEWGVTVGFLSRLTERWNLGGLYRQGADFDFNLRLETGPVSRELPPGLTFERDVSYSFPDVYGLGLAYRSRNGRWTAAAEWRRVEYSDFLESLLPEQRDPGDALDDAHEVHLGGEYAFFAGSSVLALRLGVWHDPDHQIRSDADPVEEPFIRAITPAGDDELHVTGGFGIALEKLQIDLGLDLSGRIDTASLSVIYGF